MFTIRVTTTRRELERSIRYAADEQIPFATAKTLTQLARIGRDASRARLPRVFTMRSRGLPKGIDFQRAEKRDWPRQRAYVGLKPWAGFLALHERGGVKRGERGHRIAVPTRIVKRTGRGAVVKSQRPSSILRRKGGRIDEQARVRLSSPRRRGASIFYTLHARVRVERAPFLREPVERAVRKLYARRLARNLADALATRRRRR